MRRREWRFYVYIMASISGTLYVGMTNSIRNRVFQHQHPEDESFSSRCQVNRLLYFEKFQYVKNAIAREKQSKSWRRSKKVALIESLNPNWRDLSKDFGKELKPAALVQ